MPIFYLEPKDGDTSGRSWEATYLREGYWVEAETEPVARERVAGATLQMRDVKMGEPLNVYSPWTQSRFTDCRQEDPPRSIPAGKILTKGGKLLDT